MILRYKFLCLLLILIPFHTFGSSYHFPKFGTPIISENSIVFTEDDWEAHRIISVDRKTGKEKWTIRNRRKLLGVWIAPSLEFENRFVLTIGNKVVFADDTNGNTTLAYKADFDLQSIEVYQGTKVFILGEREGTDVLQLVDLKSGTMIWEVSGVMYVTSANADVIICQRGERKDNQNGKYFQHVDLRLSALEPNVGTAKWEYKWPEDWGYTLSFIIGDYLLVNYSKVIYLFDQNGNLLKSLSSLDDGFLPETVCQKGDRILVWAKKEDMNFSGKVFEVSVPVLRAHEVAKTDWNAASSLTIGDVLIGQRVGRMGAYNLKTNKKIWEGGQWNWDGIHDGHIYYSAMDRDGKHAVLCRIEVVTGENNVLYRKSLPRKNYFIPEDESEKRMMEFQIGHRPK